MLLLLDMHWEKAKLYFTLVFLAPQARQVLESAKTQLTWMSDGVLQAFERSRDNPFALRYNPPTHPTTHPAMHAHPNLGSIPLLLKKIGQQASPAVHRC